MIEYTEAEKGERLALLEVRTFIAKHGKREVDAFCAQRLHDLMMDARARTDSHVEITDEDRDMARSGRVNAAVLKWEGKK